MRYWQQLIALMLPVWLTMVMAIFLGVLTVSSGIGLMATSAFLIASAALHPPLMALTTAIAGVRLFGLSRAVLRYLERYISHDATFRILGRLRMSFYSVLEPLVPEKLSGYHSGQLWNRLVADVDILQFFYLRVVAPVGVGLTMLAVMLCGLYYFNVTFFWLFLGSFIITGILMPVVVHLLGQKFAERLAKVKEQLNILLIDSIRGVSELSACNWGGKQAEKIGSVSKRLLTLQGANARMIAFADAWSGLGMNLTVWALLVVAIPMVHEGVVSGIHLAVVILAVQSCFEAIIPLMSVPHYLEECRQAAARIFSFSQNFPLPELKSSIYEVSPEPLSIEVKNVSFSYDGITNVLDRISFSLPVGKRLALVGTSGAGKSTLMALLLGFREYQQGSIRLGGREIRELDPEILRRLFGVVPQQTHIFHASIRENILLAKPDATELEFHQAVELAAVTDFANQLPQGYDQIAGENGHGLSGGQRQRLAIARILLKNAPLLILDEPTNSLDPMAEREVMAAVRTAMKGRTTLLITHRLLGLETMDEILVMEAGRLVERGTYQGLLQKRGLFYQLWELQQELFCGDEKSNKSFS